ncbi:protein of unknown function [Paraburkholderia dioscoreae]|uniref:Uncharacterized protein n=1 Tax=Paraburkholderia dioscoreae TaxID=2604047 RepID=A0A5Q4ZK83_9BURK|nr:protein of unknown function [Paraburkholderia dioscoreae]
MMGLRKGEHALDADVGWKSAHKGVSAHAVVACADWLLCAESNPVIHPLLRHVLRRIADSRSRNKS